MISEAHRDAIETTITIEHTIAEEPPSSRAATLIAAMFGLNIAEPTQRCLIERCDITLRRGDVVFITGPSGGGKSTLLRCIGQACASTHAVIDIARDVMAGIQPQRCVIDQFEPRDDKQLRAALAVLSIAGLAEAPLLVRAAAALSDGQAARLALAMAMHEASQAERPCIILADEFAATLDRPTACVIAHLMARWVRRTQHTLIVATTHEDVYEALQPDVVIHKDLDARVQVFDRRSTQETDTHAGQSRSIKRRRWRAGACS